MYKIKIAHCVHGLSGGVGTVIFNYFDQFDKNAYEVHVITQEIESPEYAELYRKRGYILHVVPSKKEGIVKNYKVLKKIMKQEKFDIVHCHMSVTNLFPLTAAFFSRIEVRINHSHQAPNLKMYEKATVLLSRLFTTDYFACGQDAGTVMFGKKKFRILYNAIDLKLYSYDEKERDRQRTLLGIDRDIKLYCHVGRFSPQKNHDFLIDIFSKIWEREKNSKLILIGDGELFEEVKDKVSILPCRDSILFLGTITDVDKKLQAADAFILPSRCEGLCVAAIEAQAAGLPCVLTSRIDKTTKVNDNVCFVSSDDADAWSEKCLEYAKMPRIDNTNKLEEAGFDIAVEARKLDTFYKNAVRGRNDYRD